MPKSTAMPVNITANATDIRFNHFTMISARAVVTAKPVNSVRKIGKHGLHEYVIREIGRRIVSGELAPGKSLPSEATLVSTLGVSRTALREALRVLAAKGLVDARPKIGTIVRPATEWNFFDPDIFAWRLDSHELEKVMEELHELRHIMEPSAASLAATNASAEDLANLKSAYADMEAAAVDGARVVDPDVRFHRAIFAASENSLFSALGQVIGAALEIFFQLGIENPHGQGPSLAAHKSVLDAIVARNADAARLSMRKLLEASEQDARRIRNWKNRNARAAKPTAGPARRGRA